MPQIQGLEVLLTPPDFATAPKLVGGQKTTAADLSEAHRLVAFVGDRPLHSFTHRYKFTTRAAAALLEDFFDDMRGKWRAVWVPSWHGELAPAADVANGSNQLSIQPVGYATVYNPADTNLAKLGHYIFLLHYDGTLITRRVNSVAGTSPEVLTLDAVAPRQFKVGEFIVGFLYPVRSLSDELALKFDGLNHVDTEIGWTEVNKIDAGSSGSTTPGGATILKANFTANLYSGNAPLAVNFTDTSTGTPASWLWTWGDGSANSTTQNPSHTFTNPGTYIVTLKVTNAAGETSSFSRIIAAADPTPPPVPDPLAANFTPTPSSGPAPLSVTFTDTSTGTPTIWSWNFGDGSPFDSTQSPVHIFSLPGVYTVTLTIFNGSGGTSNISKIVTVTATTATCNGGATYQDGCPGTPLSCGGCCTALAAMTIGGPIMVWQDSAILGCLGLTAADGLQFIVGGQTYIMTNSNIVGGGPTWGCRVFYDIARTA